MRRILLCSAFIASPALAGPWTVGQQTITYSAAHTLGTRNAAPAYAYEAPDVASNFTVGTWLHETGETPGPSGQFAGVGSGSEAKFRADCNVSFENHNDPIIAPGVASGASHDHTFFGNIAAATNTQNVTYASLRASGNSTCYGGPLNRTLYWEPSMKKLLPSGVIATIKPKNIITYYETGSLDAIGNGTVDDPNVATRWPRGIDFIEGFNMADPTNSRLTAIIAAANAASSPNRYSATPGVTGKFVGWTCSTPNPGESGYHPYLRNADGTAALDCAAGEIVAELSSDPCWDGVNLTSPDGRGHMMPYLQDNATGKKVCPDGWYRVMTFRAKVTFNTTGSADYKEWYASSDRMPGMTQWLNGQSMHFDLIPAWDYGTAASPGVFLKFSAKCGGQTIVMSGTTYAGDPHECGTGRITVDEQLWHNEASPDGSSPNPLVNLNPDQTGANRFFPLTGQTGTFVIQHDHTMNDIPASTRLANVAPIHFDLRRGR